MTITDTERLDYLISLINKGNVNIIRNGLLKDSYSIKSESFSLTMSTNNVRDLIDNAIERNNL